MIKFKNPFKKEKIKANDGFSNIAKGIGGKKDTLQNSSFTRISLNLAKNYELAEELYLFNWLVGNIADIPASEATREWCEISSTTNSIENLKSVKKLFKKLKIRQNIKTALSYADLFGGCALYMVVNDGQNQDKLLNLKTIKKGSFKKLRILDPSHLIPVITNLEEPEYYTLFGATNNITIHKSRLLIFRGIELTQNKKIEHNYWGGSKVQRSIEPIIASDTAINAIVNMLTETNVNVYKLDGLTDLAIDDADDDAIKRINIIDTMKSYLNALVLDSKDDFVKVKNDFKDLHQIDDKTLIRVSGSAEIPATLLFGKSPDGQNSTGASDFQNFYNRIKRIQIEKIEPKLEKLLLIASYSENSTEIKEPTINWNPLVQESRKEKADRLKVEADTYIIYLNAGVITKNDIKIKLAKENQEYFLSKAKNEN